jgi:hypothetical protein
MSINFNRYRAQLRCESILNSTTPEEWQNADFQNLILNASQASLLTNDLIDDSKDLYYKGILSFFEALKSINEGLFSWATVKAYYSIYYFLRSTMATYGVALIRQKSLYYLKVSDGQSPVKKTNKKYNSDHSGTINHYIDLFSSDILLSQEIDSVNSYDWMMGKREQINYRERTFNEPNHCDFWDYIANQVNIGRFDRLIQDYFNDPYLLCFQEEHAIIAIPFKRAILTRNRFLNESITLSLSAGQQKTLIDILPIKSRELIQLIDL